MSVSCLSEDSCCGLVLVFGIIVVQWTSLQLSPDGFSDVGVLKGCRRLISLFMLSSVVNVCLNGEWEWLLLLLLLPIISILLSSFHAMKQKMVE